MKKALFLPLFAIAAFVSQTWAADGDGYKVIADFSEGSATAFTNYSYVYAKADGTSCDEIAFCDYSQNDGEDGYFKFKYEYRTMGGFEQGYLAAYEIGVSGSFYPDGYLKDPPDFLITECTEGFSYKYRGTAHSFVTEINDVIDDNVFRTDMPEKRGEWATVEVTKNDLRQNWDPSTQQQKTWSLDKITILKWVIKKWDTGDAMLDVNYFIHTRDSLEIDDIHCLTGSEPPVDPPIDPPAAIPSYGSKFVAGLNVVSFASSLQITSDKDVTVSLFDMRGKQVFSEKRSAGSSIVSLDKQRQGLYYAVVKAGSQREIVRVTLK